MSIETNMPKIKMFIDTFVPVSTCTLRCHYCYITQSGKFAEKIPVFKYSPKTVGDALSQKRLGGVCHFNVCGGGETLLPPQMTGYLRAILEQGHYVMVITNGTVSKRFDEIAQFPREMLERLCFKFSYHYLELKKKKLLDLFFGNIKKMKNAGCSISLELTPNDEIVSLADELKQVAIERLGAPCHVTVARDETSPLRDKPILSKTFSSRESYRRFWGEKFKSDMFDYKLSVFGQKRKEFCYAGAWSGYLNLGTGVLSQCYCSSHEQNIFDDVSTPIKRVPVGKNCMEPHCYNAHAFLTLGLIPELDSIFYSRIRNRVCADGSEWLNPRMKAFLSQKLKESNREYTDFEKFVHGIAWSRASVFARKLSLEAKRFVEKLAKKARLGNVFSWRNSALRQLERLLESTRGSERIIFAGTPLHGNIGDHAIAIAMAKFFKKYFPEKKVVEIPGAQILQLRKNSQKFFAKHAQENDVVAIIGGGFLGTLWLNEEEMVRKVVRAFPSQRIVIFPQTVFFDDTKSGQAELKTTREICRKHRDLHIFIRDKSIDFLHKKIVEKNARTAPDIVLSLDRSAPKFEREGVLLCFRADKEKVLPEATIAALEEKLRARGENVARTDTVVPYAVSAEQREFEVERKFDEFRRARLVITDRLHGMIFAAITGTPCIALDNSSGKVGGVCSLWLRNLHYVKFVQDAEGIFPLLDEFLALGTCRYAPSVFEKYWQELADVVAEK